MKFLLPHDVVPHRSCHKNGLLTCVRLRKRWTAAHCQEGDKHQIKKKDASDIKWKLLMQKHFHFKMETFVPKWQQLTASDMRREILTRVCASSFYQDFSISISISQSVHKGQIIRLVSWYLSLYLNIAEKQEARDFLGLQGILEFHEVPVHIKKLKMCKLGIIYYFCKLRIRIEKKHWCSLQYYLTGSLTWKCGEHITI